MPTGTVGVTADRRGDEQELLLTRLGLSVVRGPTLGTVVAPRDDRLRAVTEAIIERPPGYVVADTGFGMRAWLAAADGWGRRDALLTSLRGARIAARGPKASGALRSAGLEVWWRAPDEQLATVVDHLVAQGPAGMRVAVQLHGEDEPAVRERLEAAGATVVEVPVYEWIVPPDSRPAARLVELTCGGSIDALTFTSAPAVRNLFALAASLGLRDELVAACNRNVLVACVGPVCAEPARAEGVADPRFPDHWRLGSLVKLVAEELDRRQATAPAGGAWAARED